MKPISDIIFLQFCLVPQSYFGKFVLYTQVLLLLYYICMDMENLTCFTALIDNNNFNFSFV